MLKRFMSWLLHRLQKLLSPLSSGRRHHAHPPVPAQNAVEAEQGVESDIYLSVDASAAPQVIPVNPSASTAASELIASGALNYLLEAPHTDDLPEIHDLLPAIEPEESVEPIVEASTETPTAASAELPGESPAEEDLLSSPSLAASVEPVEQVTARPDDEPEASPEENIQAAVAPPAQAVLFSFDIVESEAAPVEPAVPKPSVPEATTAAETPSKTFEPDDFATTPPAAAVTDSAYSSEGSDDTENSHSVENAESPENSDSERLAAEIVAVESVPAGLKTGHIDIIIEGASPEENEPAEPILAGESQSPEAHPSEADSPTENPDQAIDHSLSEEPVKQGVVKLLFTLKQGNFHGYIAPDDGTKDILFHQKYINANIFDRLERGTKVVAAVKYIEGKAYATRVDLL